MKSLVFYSLVRNWDELMEVMKAMILGWCWKEKDLKNQKSLTTLLAYILSWYTNTTLSTKFLATQELLNCVVFLISKVKVVDIINTGQ